MGRTTIFESLKLYMIYLTLKVSFIKLGFKLINDLKAWVAIVLMHLICSVVCLYFSNGKFYHLAPIFLNEKNTTKCHTIAQ